MVLAVQFMTRIPAPTGLPYRPELYHRSVRYYPVAGLFVGAAGAVVFVLGDRLVGGPLAALFAIAAMIWLTGALHEDGLADLFDALGGNAPRARALEIMRDSRIGTYGVLALIVTVGARVLALGELPVAWVPWLLVAGACASRAGIVLVMSRSKYLRAQGAASGVSAPQQWTALLFVGLVAAAALCATPWIFVPSLPPYVLLAALLGWVGGTLLVWQWFQRRLGGYTGDCLGAVQQLSELGMYLAVAAVY